MVLSKPVKKYNDISTTYNHYINITFNSHQNYLRHKRNQPCLGDDYKVEKLNKTLDIHMGTFTPCK